jgi:hypothetical protein
MRYIDNLHWYIVVFDGNKAQYMILIHNRMHSIKIKKLFSLILILEATSRYVELFLLLILKFIIVISPSILLSLISSSKVIH